MLLYIMSFNQMCVVVNFHYFFFICFEWAKLSCFNATLPTVIVSGFFPIKCYQMANISTLYDIFALFKCF